MPIIRLRRHVCRIIIILNGIAIGCRRVIEQGLNIGRGVGKSQSPLHRSIDVRSPEVSGIYHRIQCKDKGGEDGRYAPPRVLGCDNSLLSKCGNASAKESPRLWTRVGATGYMWMLWVTKNWSNISLTVVVDSFADCRQLSLNPSTSSMLCPAGGGLTIGVTVT